MCRGPERRAWGSRGNAGPTTPHEEAVTPDEESGVTAMWLHTRCESTANRRWFLMSLASGLASGAIRFSRIDAMTEKPFDSEAFIQEVEALGPSPAGGMVGGHSFPNENLLQHQRLKNLEEAVLVLTRALGQLAGELERLLAEGERGL